MRGVIEGMTDVNPGEVVWPFCWESSSGCVKGGKRRVAVVTKTGVTCSSSYTVSITFPVKEGTML